MAIQVKSLDDTRVSTLIMLTAKAAEECVPCLEAYKEVARKAGATEKEIQFALAVGARTKKSILAAQGLDEETKQESGVKYAEGKNREVLLQNALANENVQRMDAFFRELGYQPVEEARAVLHYQMGASTCTGTYLPYGIKGDENSLAWIGYNIGQEGEDLGGVIADFGLLRKFLESGDKEAGENFLRGNYIVENGAVVAGHACDTNCFFSHIQFTCGSCIFPCLISTFATIPCIIACCGTAATIACFLCGCC